MNHFSSTVSTIVRQKRRSEGYLLVLLVHGFLVLRESRRSLSVEPVQVVTLCAKVTCTGMNGVEIMTRVPRRHGDRHGESKDTSPKISNKSRLYDRITRNKVFRFYSMFIKWYSVVILTTEYHSLCGFGSANLPVRILWSFPNPLNPIFSESR